MDIFIKALWAFLAIISMAFLSYVATRYIGGKANRAMRGKYINIIESVSLGPDKQIHLIKVGEQYVLIASAGKTVEFLTTLKLEEEIPEEGMDSSGNMFEFKAFFEKYLKSFKVRRAQKNGTKDGNDNIRDPVEREVFKSNLNKLKSITSRVDKQDVKDGDDITNEK